MNDVQDRPTIVVGVSGSPASAGALRWAAEESRHLGGQLKVVLIWSAEQRAYYAPPVPAQEPGARRRQASDALAATVDAVLGQRPHCGLSLQAAEGSAERALVRLSAGADLLVLGSATAQLAGRPLGPVVRTCLSRARCPVVVVGPETAAGPGPAAQRGASAGAERDDLAVQLAGGLSALRGR
jgi:nucleotide-binding universal stress UspA family protein